MTVVKLFWIGRLASPVLEFFLIYFPINLFWKKVTEL